MPEVSPSAGALEAVRRLAGSSAAIGCVLRLQGGQHALTWRVQATNPDLTVVVRQFPAADPAPAREQEVLEALDGLGGLAPVPLGGDRDARWSEYPTSLISWLDGHADITPSVPETWATQLGQTLAIVHAMPLDRLSGLPSVLDRGSGSLEALAGPLATTIQSRWAQITGASKVLTHSDYWSGNVVWRDESLTGIVDWSGAAVGPRGFDVGWCRLDLVLLFEQRTADIFLAAYESAVGRSLKDVGLWDSWAVARSHDAVETWAPNYAPLG
ncbi:MAG: hypothetical protein QOG59_1397, partial [Solirubrobacteraceae bacterium]|nr:hypothetical protein [Solirubrobacteraceae bacterium]